MSQRDPEVWMVYQLDALHESFEVVGVFSQEPDAEAMLAEIPDSRHPALVTTTMRNALAQIRREAEETTARGLQKHMQSMAKRLSELTAVVASRQAAA